MHKRIILSGVYQYSFKNGGRKYIGSSINLNKRHEIHISSLKTNTHYSIHFQNDFNKHGIENLKYEILEYIDNQPLKNNSISKKDFQKICFEKEQNYLNSYYAQEYLKNSKDTRFFSLLYNKSVIANYCYSKKKQEIEKEVYKYALNGDYIESYYNSAIAEICCKIDSSSIRRCCQKIRKSAGGFMWDYNKVEKLVKYQRDDQKAINQYDINKNFINRYNSIIEAQKATMIDIRKEKDGNAITQGGYYWLYDNENFPEFKRKSKWESSNKGDKIAKRTEEAKFMFDIYEDEWFLMFGNKK